MLQEDDNEDNPYCDSDQACQLGEGQGDTELFLSLQPTSLPSLSHAECAAVSQPLLGQHNYPTLNPT